MWHGGPFIARYQAHRAALRHSKTHVAEICSLDWQQGMSWKMRWANVWQWRAQNKVKQQHRVGWGRSQSALLAGAQALKAMFDGKLLRCSNGWPQAHHLLRSLARLRSQGTPHSQPRLSKTLLVLISNICAIGLMQMLMTKVSARSLKSHRWGQNSCSLYIWIHSASSNSNRDNSA